MGWLKKTWNKVKKNAGAIVVGAVVAATGGAAAFAIAPGAFAAGATMLTVATSAFVVAGVTGVAMTILADTPDAPSFDAAIRSQMVTGKSPTEPAKIVYGLTRVGGNIVFLEASDDNKTLYMVITLAGHQINAVTSVYVNEERFSAGINWDQNGGFGVTYKGKTGNIQFELTDGSDAGRTIGILQGTTAENYRYQGIAVMAVKLVYDADVFPNGVPNFTARVEGKIPLGNASDVIKDYLTDATYGLGVETSEIHTASFDAARNTSNEVVSGEKRYEINGMISSSETPQAVLGKMLASCAGRLVYAGGQWKLFVGSYTAPTVTLSEDDIVGTIQVVTSESRRDRFNAIKGIYSEPGVEFQPVSFPAVTNATYEAEDGERIYRDLTFPMTTSSAACQRLAKIELERSRQQIVVTLQANLKAFKAQPGEVIALDFARYGWEAKEFEVIEWTVDFSKAAPVVDLSLRETASGIYDWADGEETTVDLAANTNLPDPFTVSPPGITISDELEVNAERVITKLLVEVTGDSVFQDRYEVQAKPATATEYLNLGQASGNKFELLDVIDGATYNVRARSINTLAVKSEWTTGSHQVVGKTAPPSDVTGLTGNLIGNQYFLTWNAVPDLDLSYYRVRYAAPDGAPTYQNSISLVPKVSRPATSVFVPARNGTYFVKAVDKLGIASENPISIVLDTNISQLENLNVIQTLTEHPDFNGTFDDVVEIDEDDRLVLDTSLAFDAAPGNFDDAAGQFDGGSGNVDGSGYYYFGNSADLGAVYLTRVTAKLKQVRLDYVNLFDDASGLFDNREGSFDGDVNAFDNVDAWIEMRFTSDDPAGTPTWSDWQQFVVSDVRARAFEFRCKLTTLDDQASPAVSELEVTLDMPDRVESAQDIVSGAGAKAVTFATAFQATPAIGIGAQDLATGDYYEITSKSRSGFTITFKNSGGTAVSRTFDYVAKGYGKEVS